MEKSALQLEIEKSFPVSADKLYKAWITTDDLKKWWKPSENELKNAEQEVTEGGNIKYEFKGKDSQTDLIITGKYKEVKENEKLVYSWNWDLPADAVQKSEHELTVEFIAEGDNSRIKVTQTNFQDDESITPHKEGWEKALNSLHDYLGSL